MGVPASISRQVPVPSRPGSSLPMRTLVNGWFQESTLQPAGRSPLNSSNPGFGNWFSGPLCRGAAAGDQDGRHDRGREQRFHCDSPGSRQRRHGLYLRAGLMF